MINTLRSLLFYVVYGGSLIPHASLCVLLGWMLPLKTRYRYFVQWNRFVVWWVGVCCGVTFRMEGREKIPSEPYVMLSNHQSPWETLFLYCEFQPLCAVLKRELLRIPFFGWALALLDPIAIDRSKRRSARESMLEQGRRQLKHGVSVLVFPEGTRGERRRARHRQRSADRAGGPQCGRVLAGASVGEATRHHHRGGRRTDRQHGPRSARTHRTGQALGSSDAR
jgi:1-acyl-sn-glycerol-3-phosphate acyltransferase